MLFKNLPAFLLFIPLAAFYIFRHKKSNDFYIYSFFSEKKGYLLSVISSSLYILSSVFVVIALSAPSFKTEKIRYISPGDNYFFILDVSPSMSVNDIDGMRRIDAAKKIIEDYRKTRGNDYPGLILFSNEAFLSVPPSPDLNWFDEAVKRADVIYPDRGTAVGDAVALSVFYLKKSEAEDKIGILISDGISNTGSVSPLAAAKAASENKIKIYTVSLGNVTAGSKGSSYNEDYLEMIASETGAMHFSGENIRELEYAFSFISSMENRERISEKVIETENIGSWFTAAALICLLISGFIKIFILKEITL